MSSPLLIGLDIGGTKIRLASASAARPSSLLKVRTIPTPTSFALAQKQLEPLLDQLVGRRELGAIGIASPGPVDLRRGRIGRPTNLHWHQADIIAWAQDRWKVPAVLGSDAAWGAVCEAQLGAAKRFRYALYITISTGIGSALTLDGWPLPGPHNTEGGRMLLADEHGRPITFEHLTSGSAILRDYGRIAAKIRGREPWKEISQRLALGLYNLIVATDPEVIVFAGGVSLHHTRFFKPLRAALAQLDPMYPLPPFRVASYVEEAPLIGAILGAGARAHLLRPPRPRTAPPK